MRRLALLALALAFPLLAGCVDVEEDLLLTPAGSGSLRLHYWTRETNLDPVYVPGGVANRIRYFDPAWLRKSFENSGVEVGDVQVERVEGERHARLLLHFTRVKDLERPALLQGLECRLTRTGDRVEVRHRIYPQAVVAAVTDDRAPKPVLLAAFFAGHFARLRLQVPGHSVQPGPGVGSHADGALLEQKVPLVRLQQSGPIEIALTADSTAGHQVGLMFIYLLVLGMSVVVAGPGLFGWAVNFKWSM